MKKASFYRFGVTILIFILSQAAIAQNTAPYWSLAGNNNATAASKLGTTNDVSLRIYAGNVQRMLIGYSTGNVGIGITDPTERLHVNSASGKNAFRAQVNGNTKLLVHSAGGVAIGANTTPPANGLYVFGNTGIGISSPTRKLHVAGTSEFTANMNISEGGLTATNTGLYGVVGKGSTAGVQGIGSGTFSIGVDGASSHIGVYGSGPDYGIIGVATSFTGYGVYGYNIEGKGVYGQSTHDAGVYGYSTNNIAGYFYTPTGNGVWGKTDGTASYVYAGVFEGNVLTSGMYMTSDKTIKKNFREVAGAMNIINKLKPKNYEFITDGKYAGLGLPKGEHYGFLAQDIEEVLPNLVKEGPKGLGRKQAPPPVKGALPPSPVPTEDINIKAVNYIELIPIIIKGMQEQNEIIQQQQQQIEILKKEINALSANKNSFSTVSGSTLSQNAPNPVKGSTAITYSTPAGAGKVQLMLTDNTGKLLKTVLLQTSGTLQLDVTSLLSGTYSYSLVVDGKIMETKKMTVIND